MKNESARAMDALDEEVSSEGVWLVKTASGLRTWTLDELDAAFQRGEVDASTLVMTWGVSTWTSLGVLADLDEAAGGDTSAPEASSPRAVAPPAAAAPPGAGRSKPPPLHDLGSFAPTGASVSRGGAAPQWASIATPPTELSTGLRHHSPMVPFAVRRALGGALDWFASVRVAHPRWAAVGPWLFGAGLSATLMLSLYRAASSPVRESEVVLHSAPARGVTDQRAAAGAASSGAAGADAARAGSASAPGGSGFAEDEVTARASSVSRSLTARAGGEDSNERALNAAAREGATRESSASEDAASEDAASDGAVRGVATSASDDGDVLPPRDLRLAPGRSERQLTRQARARAKAKAGSTGSGRKAKARAARRARRSARAE